MGGVFCIGVVVPVAVVAVYGEGAVGGTGAVGGRTGALGQHVVAVLHLADGQLVGDGVALLPYVALERAFQGVLYGVAISITVGYARVAALSLIFTTFRLDDHLQFSPTGDGMRNHEEDRVADIGISISAGSCKVRIEGVRPRIAQTAPCSPCAGGGVYGGRVEGCLGVDVMQANLLDGDTLGDIALGKADGGEDMLEAESDHLVVLADVGLFVQRLDIRHLRLAPQQVVHLAGGGGQCVVGQLVGQRGWRVETAASSLHVDILHRRCQGIELHAAAAVGPVGCRPPVGDAFQQYLVEDGTFVGIGAAGLVGLIGISPDGQRVVEVGAVDGDDVGVSGACGWRILSTRGTLSTHRPLVDSHQRQGHAYGLQPVGVVARHGMSLVVVGLMVLPKGNRQFVLLLCADAKLYAVIVGATFSAVVEQCVGA